MKEKLREIFGTGSVLYTGESDSAKLKLLFFTRWAEPPERSPVEFPQLAGFPTVLPM